MDKTHNSEPQVANNAHRKPRPYTHAQRQRDKAAQKGFYRHPKPTKVTYNGVTFDSQHEANWARAFDALGIEYAADGMEALEKGVGGWVPDFALPRANGGWVWAEVKPFRTDVLMFSLVRQKLESATQIDRDTDALLYLDKLPTLGDRPFGLGAINRDLNGHRGREWVWDAAWYWRRSPSGPPGLRLGCGVDLLLNDTLVEAGSVWLPKHMRTT